jgi:hypothetical protein
LRGLLILVALIASPAAAQDIMSGDINQSWTSSQLLLNSEKKAWAAPECIDAARWSVDCPGPRPSKPAEQGTTAGDGAELTFRPSPEQRRRNFAAFVEKTRAVDPAGAAGLEQALTTDVIGMVGTSVAPLGLRTDNVADAIAIYVMEAWEVANGQVLQPSRARAQAVRRQMVRAISATPDFARADDAAKQELAESMLIHAAMLSSSYQQAMAGGDKALMTAVSDAARQGAQASLGFDLRAMAMTEAGLRDRRAAAR